MNLAELLHFRKNLRIIVQSTMIGDSKPWNSKTWDAFLDYSIKSVLLTTVCKGGRNNEM